jgi:hypothetical protein
MRFNSTRTARNSESRARLAYSLNAHATLSKDYLLWICKTLYALIRVNQILLTGGLLAIGFDRINR